MADVDASGTIWSALVSETPTVRSGSSSFQRSRWSARSGQAGKLRFAAGKGTVLAVPKHAVTRAGGSDGVFVVGNDNVVRLSPVTLGAEFGDRVEVLSGLSAGARVAVSPVDRLVDGAVAEIRR